MNELETRLVRTTYAIGVAGLCSLTEETAGRLAALNEELAAILEQAAK